MSTIKEARLVEDRERQRAPTPDSGFAGRLRSSGLVIGLGIWVARIVVAGLFCGVWQYVSARQMIDPILIGSPAGTFQAFWAGVFTEGTFLPGLGHTLLATAIAFGLGSAVGVFVGLLFAVSPFVERLFDPFFTGMNSMPRLALAPLFLLWFGLGIGAKIALGFSLTFFIVLNSTVAGIRSVDADLSTLTSTLGASGTQRFFRLTLPNAVPTLFAGLRLGLVYGLLGVVGQELIGSRNGIGQELSVLAGTFQTNGVFAVLILLAILGTLLTWSTSVLERHLLRWR